MRTKKIGWVKKLTAYFQGVSGSYQETAKNCPKMAENISIPLQNTFSFVLDWIILYARLVVGSEKKPSEGGGLHPITK